MRLLTASIVVGVTLLAVAAMPLTNSASAHLMSAGFGSINIRSNDLILLIALPVAVLNDIDDNHDGLFQPDEIRQHRSDILKQLAASFIMRIGDVDWSVTDDELLVSLHTDNLGSTPQIEWWQRRVKPAGISSNACVEISASWFDENLLAQQQFVYVIQIHQNEQTEIITLTRDMPHVRAFCDHEHR